MRKWQSAWRRKPLPFVDLMRAAQRRDGGALALLTVTGMVAVRDIGPVTGALSGQFGHPVTPVTGGDQLRLGRAEIQARAYDD